MSKGRGDESKSNQKELPPAVSAFMNFFHCTEKRAWELFQEEQRKAGHNPQGTEKNESIADQVSGHGHKTISTPPGAPYIRHIKYGNKTIRGITLAPLNIAAARNTVTGNLQKPPLAPRGKNPTNPLHTTRLNPIEGYTSHITSAREEGEEKSRF